MVRIEFDDGRTATLEAGVWRVTATDFEEDVESLRLLLEARTRNEYPSPAEPDPDLYLAKIVANAYGGRVTSADEPEYEEGAVY